MANILLLDNVDSFTYNLVDQLRKHKHNVLVYRNTVSIQIISQTLMQLINPIVVLSPGPGLPHASGCMLDLIKTVKGQVPIIGICLGHQAIVEAYGGTIEYASEIFHSKVSLIQHDGLEMFKDIPQPLSVASIDSLICNQLPACFIINSSIDNMIMSIRHNADRVCGFQFHPESILTPYGDQILEQIICWSLLKYDSNIK
uniref:anthranilate synthase n=1 Tax=Buchnera aphidicola TaxID=9 RepID=Q9JMU8_9GAMM|nr:anthranilate synthase small subunit [Buchnera aphidicola]